MRCLTFFLLLLIAALPLSADSIQTDSVKVTMQTINELKEENALLQVRSNIDFLSSLIILSVVMIFFMWGIRERNRKHVMLLERKNNALTRANKKAEEARQFAEHESNLKSVFLKNLSHELRTPLNQIYGFAQVLNNNDVPITPEEQKDMINAICDSAAHLTHIIDNAGDVTEKLSGLTKLEEVESIFKLDNNQNNLEQPRTT